MHEALEHNAAKAKKNMIMTIAAMLCWALFSNIISPDSLLQAIGSYFVIDFGDDTAYQSLVGKVTIGYQAVWGVLIVLALWTKHQWMKSGTKA